MFVYTRNVTTRTTTTATTSAVRKPEENANEEPAGCSEYVSPIIPFFRVDLSHDAKAFPRNSAEQLTSDGGDSGGGEFARRRLLRVGITSNCAIASRV